MRRAASFIQRLRGEDGADAARADGSREIDVDEFERFVLDVPDPGELEFERKRSERTRGR